MQSCVKKKGCDKVKRVASQKQFYIYYDLKQSIFKYNLNSQPRDMNKCVYVLSYQTNLFETKYHKICRKICDHF